MESLVMQQGDCNVGMMLEYTKGAPPIWVTTDGCLTGGGGYVSQGADPNEAKIVGFWSGKWSSAQQNYPVHELELLVLVETLKQFRGILHGTQFTVRMDHQALVIAANFSILFQPFYRPTLNTLFIPLSTSHSRIIQDYNEATTNCYDCLF